jgi:DUF4097 and DUF4098 domain-containing protein YvlB
MKKHTLFMAGWLLTTIGLILIVSSGVRAQDSGEFTVPFSEPAKRGKLKAHINSGSITIKGSPRKDILVQYSSGEAHNEEAKTTKDGLKRISRGTLDLEVTENENFVKVESGSWNKPINLVIEVPLGIDLQVHTYNHGDLNINTIQGELELNNYNGKITAENISGAVVATTYNGTIKATFDKVTDGAPMSYSTYNGNIDLTFPASLKATLKMRTDGEILSSFDVNLSKGAPVQNKESKSGMYKVVIDEWVRGDINGGGPEISMKNYHGNIYVRKK